MYSVIPKLSNIEHIGWESLLKKLMSTAFMAPIFMFFVFLIFKLIQTPVIRELTYTEAEQDTFQVMLLMIIQALIILALLRKATEYAKKGGGGFAEVVLKGTKIIGGLAIGAATGGAALGLSGGVGALASRAGSSKTLQEAKTATGIKGFAARAALRTVDYGAKASFDVRNIPGVGALAKTGGVTL